MNILTWPFRSAESEARCREMLRNMNEAERIYRDACGEFIYVIAATPHAAHLYAEMVRRLHIAPVYETKAVAVAAWELQPAPMRSRYHVYEVVLDDVKRLV